MVNTFKPRVLICVLALFCFWFYVLFGFFVCLFVFLQWLFYAYRDWGTESG